MAPPDKKNCITLIIVVVAVVVGAIVAPYALAAASSLVGGGATVATASTSGLMLAGAITGAVTNVASQAVAVAAGVQDKFDWKGVAMAAVGGAVGAGFNAVTSNSIVSSVAPINGLYKAELIHPGKHERPLNWPRWNGSPGSTTTDCWSRSAIYRQPKLS